MNKIIFFTIFIIINCYKLKSDEILITINRQSCFTCKSELLEEVIKTIKIFRPNTTFNIVITDINQKQVNFLKKQIDTTFKNVSILYDINKYYKNKFKVQEPIEYIIDNNSKIIKYIDPNKFLKAIADMKNDENSNLVHQKSNSLYLTNLNLDEVDSLELEGEFDFLSFTNSFMSKNSILFYDDISNKIGIVNNKDKNKHSSLNLGSFVLNKLKLIDSTIYSTKFSNSPKQIRFHSFIDKKDTNDYIIFSILTGVDEIIKSNRIINVPHYEYYILSFNIFEFKSINTFYLPSGYTIFGRQQIGYRDENYYVNVFDSKYQHRKHNELKDTTNLMLQIKNKSIVKVLTFKEIEEMTKTPYGLFFSQNLHQSENNIFIVGIENNVLFEIEKDNYVKLIEDKEGIIKSIYDSNNVENKNIYLEGEPYKNKTGFVLMNVIKSDSLVYFLFRNHNEKSHTNNYTIEIYNYNKKFKYKLDFFINKDIENLALHTIDSKQYIIIYCENILYKLKLNEEH